jgi:hypothetical protein
MSYCLADGIVAEREWVIGGCEPLRIQEKEIAMSMTPSIVAVIILYLLIQAAARLPRLVALVIASVTGSVLVRLKRRSERALISVPVSGGRNSWQRTTRVERRLLRRALRDTMRLTVHRSLFPDVTSF